MAGFLRSVLVAIFASAVLTGSSLPQEKREAPANRTVEPPQTTGPQTTGQAQQPAPPTGHRQPTAREVPQESNDAPVSPAQRELDRRLNICRGC